jgi:hypothetical protein
VLEHGDEVGGQGAALDVDLPGSFGCRPDDGELGKDAGVGELLEGGGIHGAVLSVLKAPFREPIEPPEKRAFLNYTLIM